MTARILAVEDNAVNLQLMTYLLRSLGHDVTEATGGQEALDLAAEGTFDLVLLDVHMPGVDGYQVLAWLKSQPRFRYTPIAAVTALAMVGDRERLLASGFDAYISKPIEPELFADQVREILLAGARSFRTP